MNPQSVDSSDTHGIEQARWRLDPTSTAGSSSWIWSRAKRLRRTLERRVPCPPLLRPHHRQGTVRTYEGTLDLRSEPAVHLTIDAESLDTKQKKRDEHRRSTDFFDVERHPQVQFISDCATLDRDRLKAHGQLHAARKTIRLELEATLSHVDGEREVQAITHADHRELVMTWSPLGILGAHSKLIVSGHLIRQADDDR
jgi:hypothetical protein